MRFYLCTQWRALAAARRFRTLPTLGDKVTVLPVVHSRRGTGDALRAAKPDALGAAAQVWHVVNYGRGVEAALVTRGRVFEGCYLFTFGQGAGWD